MDKGLDKEFNVSPHRQRMTLELNDRPADRSHGTNATTEKPVCGQGPTWTVSITRRSLAAVTFIMAAGALAIALLTQHVLGYQPCPWCIVQRIAYLWVAALACLACALPAKGCRTVMAFTLPGSIGAAVVATYQQFVAAPTGGCALTWPDRMLMASGLDQAVPWFFQVTAACDEANRPMLGVPYALWSLALSLVLIALTMTVLWRGGMRTTSRS